MSDNTVGFSASLLLGVVYARISMALDEPYHKGTRHKIEELKDYLDREITRIYFPETINQPK